MEPMVPLDMVERGCDRSLLKRFGKEVKRRLNDFDVRSLQNNPNNQGAVQGMEQGENY